MEYKGRRDEITTKQYLVAFLKLLKWITIWMLIAVPLSYGVMKLQEKFKPAPQEVVIVGGCSCCNNTVTTP